jgi:23S rRNA pseudouridine2605 synthase
MERLQKILSQAGVASRRASEQMMLDGRVTVNGVTILELGTKADPARDDIRVDGRRVKVVEHHRYLLLNKPRGYVTTRSDPQRRPTVLDLLRGVKEYVYPVGRLDYESEGLLLLMNDGDLAALLTHPSHGIARFARVLAFLTRTMDRLQRGTRIDAARAAEVTLLPVKAR